MAKVAAMSTWRTRLAEMIDSCDAPIVDPRGAMAPTLLFDSCCRCISLRTGSLAIAYYYLVAVLVMATTVVAGEAYLEAVKNSIDPELHHSLPRIEDTEGIMLGLWFLMMPFITALLVGLHKNKAIYVKVYLMAVFAYFVLEITLFFCIVMYYKMNMYLIAARFIAIVIDGYFFVMVRSHYYKMIRA